MRWKGFIDTIIRFPLTIILLAAAVVTNIIQIALRTEEPYTSLFITFLFGASFYVVEQLLYERFFQGIVCQIIMIGSMLAASIVYYILVHNTGWTIPVSTRTAVIFFILLIAFLWIPEIQSRYSFNHSCMAAFKGFFAALFYMGILFIGVALVIAAFNLLIVRVNSDAYEYAATLIFTFLAPVYFLTLLPVYPRSGEERQQPKDIGPNVIADINGAEEALLKAVSPARFLVTLISYIIIPVTAVFTVILLLYIIRNIFGTFWTDNLMEPLLVTYSITVIIVYLLASNLKNAFANYFRLIFPKVLVPIVLFQTVASVIKAGEEGLTYGRYFVILFGIFAVFAGIIFCILPVRKNGVLAPVLMVLSLISIIPPVDAFTVSKVSQTARLERSLKSNGMLKEDILTPKSDVSEKDKKIIISAINYLDQMDYTKNIFWLSSYHKSGNFKTAFGFTGFTEDKDRSTSVMITRDDTKPLPVSGYDYILYRSVSNNGQDFLSEAFDKQGKSYTLKITGNSSENPIIILSEKGKEILRFDLGEMFDKMRNSNKTMADTKDVTFTKKNENAQITVIAQSVYLYESAYESNRNADIYILIQVL